jgi:hypothetical protein
MNPIVATLVTNTMAAARAKSVTCGSSGMLTVSAILMRININMTTARNRCQLVGVPRAHGLDVRHDIAAVSAREFVPQLPFLAGGFRPFPARRVVALRPLDKVDTLLLPEAVPLAADAIAGEP